MTDVELAIMIKNVARETVRKMTATARNGGQKRYNIMQNVGSAKYLVNFHDGIKTHSDGSDFFDSKIFKNKPDLETFEQSLIRQGYKYGN
jgi:hypothetical protein